jgi:hypothetical protein
MRLLLAAVPLLLVACASSPPAPPPSTGSLQLVDLVDDFAAFQERSAAMADAARVEAFKAHFATVLPGFYSNERVGAPDYDARILKALKEYPEKRAAIEDISRRFGSLLTPAELRFEKAFGSMAGSPPVILVHSLGEFDGGLRSLPEGGRLLFGADMVARYHASHDILPFFHHELFHLYHRKYFQDCDAVWCNLWDEGLATYVAKALNPSATDEDLLLTVPQPMREVIERDRRASLCPVLQRLNSEDAGDMKALFSRGGQIASLPPRSGYYVGYLIAAEAGKTRSPQELAQLNNEQVRVLVESTLRSLAPCGD